MMFFDGRGAALGWLEALGYCCLGLWKLTNSRQGY